MADRKFAHLDQEAKHLTNPARLRRQAGQPSGFERMLSNVKEVDLDDIPNKKLRSNLDSIRKQNEQT